MKIFSPDVSVSESPLRLRIGTSGLLVVAAVGGVVLGAWAARSWRRRGRPRFRTVGPRLQEIARLRQQGLISDTEHDQARARILAAL